MRYLALALLLALPARAEISYPVVDTGQETCFDDRGHATCPAPGRPFHGQDAQYRFRAPAYRDNGDGTVTDLVTGLMWQQEFRRTPFADAPADAAASRVGGHMDWRVPTIKELYSLIDFRGSTGSAPPHMGRPDDAWPYLDTRFFAFEYPAQGRFIDAQYISGTVYLGTTMGRDRAFFGVNFADGRIKGYPQDGGPGRRTWYARYVRGNPAYGQNDFVDAGDGTVADRATGLTWLKADSGDGAFRNMRMRDGRLDWKEALKFCEDLDFAGRTDWRLPDAKELHSLVDYSRSPEATGSAAIDPVFAITAIRDPEGERDWPYFWTSTSHLDGPRLGDFGIYIAFGRAQGHLRDPRGGGVRLLDVHGAGAQRSSPKSGDESRLPVGAGPQGDVLRIYNFARCVRGG
ncbi:MAG: DUF1566 domain-containing protein [Magnetospirillum sp. WYHS-4]